MTEPFADQQLADHIAGYNALGLPPAAELGAPAMREAAEGRVSEKPRGPQMDAVDGIRLSGDVGARLYQPVADVDTLVVYLHGGGWVIGDLETHDRTCRLLARDSGSSVLAVDYRRAPEHPYPAAVDDAVAALRWAAERSYRRVVVAGDSAGGTTATMACLRLRSEEPALLPDGEVLVYANTTFGSYGDSAVTYGHGFGLELADTAWFDEQWVPDAALRRRIGPLLADDLSGMPPTVVVTCELDPLRDQGEVYAARLRDAGVTTTLRREPGMVHNFLLWDLVSPACAAAGGRVAEDVRRLVSD